jgi:sugar/nucleoside kinase (ribokinase family)
MTRSCKIIGVGSPIVDAIAHVDEAFLRDVPGEKGGMELVDAATIAELLARIDSPPVETPGGSAGNTLFALARMGVPAAFLGKIGGDTGSFKSTGVPNGRCLSLVTPDGERTMRTDLGAAMTLGPEEVTIADFEKAEHCHIEGYLLFNRDLMLRVLQRAREAGCTISLDLASFEVVEAARDILPQLLRDYVTVVFANEEEAEAFTGLGGDYPAMAAQLSGLCDCAAVKVGAEGAWVAKGGRVEKVEAVPAAEVVDTTGAGDLWAAGFLYGWFQQRDIAECARIGALLGSAVVQQEGSVLPDAVWNDILAQLGA